MNDMPCPHLGSAASRSERVEPSAPGCEECLATKSRWVHLRLCLTCGHVGCCDSSPNKHSTKHFHATKHPVIRSYEPGESWGWCFEHEAYAEELPALDGEAAPEHYAPK